MVSDIGGPTANMYQMRCTRPEVEAKCKRLSCVHPTICKLLGTDHGPLVDLMRQSREVPGIDKVFVASGIRMDLAQKSPEYMAELAKHHVGGHLKVAPEHTDSNVLRLMKKPDSERFPGLRRGLPEGQPEAGKKQFVVPYFIASHPGSDLNAMIDLAVFLKRNGYGPTRCRTSSPPRSTSPRACTTRARPVHGRRGLRRQGLAGPEDAAGVDAVLQARELLRWCGRLCSRRGDGDLIGIGLRLPDPGPAAAGRPSRRGGGRRMRRPKATITIRSPTQRRASRSASAACRIRATDRGGRQHVVRTRSVNGKAAVVDRSVKRLGLVPYVEGNASPRPHSVSRGDRKRKSTALTTKLSGPETAETTGNRSGDRCGGRGLLQREVRRPARRRPPRC